MKKKLLIILSLFIVILNASAQIIITTADMPTPTTVIYQAKDTVPTISIGNAGVNQTWNLTGLVQHTFDTSTVMPYSSIPNAVFSSANFAVKQGSQNFYGYLLNTSTSLTFLGGSGLVDIQGTPTSINQINTPAELLFKFPTSYDSSFTNNYSSNAKFFYGQTVQGITVDSIQQKSDIQKTFTVDGWGTLTTPLAGGPFNVLRSKETKITHDTTTAYISIFGSWTIVPGGVTSDSTVTYSWWANGIGSALATATMDSTGAVSSVKWLLAIPPALPPLSGITSATNITCPGSCDGTGTVIGNWGTSPYSYSWNTNPVQNTDSATGLCVGTYTVTITDAVQATSTAIVTINTAAHPTISASGTTLSTDVIAASFQWYLNGNVIANATSSNYTVTQNGHYTVTVFGCSDTSAVYNFNTIGIKESIVNNSFTIYPNPATNQITIKFDAYAPLHFATAKQDILIEINNELGQHLKKAIFKQLLIGKNEMAIDVADLPNGVYFIQIQNQNTTVNKKFIKQ